jgi:hypothetical protein
MLVVGQRRCHVTLWMRVPFIIYRYVERSYHKRSEQLSLRRGSASVCGDIIGSLRSLTPSCAATQHTACAVRYHMYYGNKLPLSHPQVSHSPHARTERQGIPVRCSTGVHPQRGWFETKDPPQLRSRSPSSLRVLNPPITRPCSCA